MASLNVKITANFIRQIYVSALGVIILPFYLHYLGSSAFGLLAFYTVLHSFLVLLDAGLTPAFSRQVAFIRGGTKDFLELKKIIRSLEIIFCSIALMLIFSMYLSVSWISHHWLNTQGFSIHVVERSLLYMSICFVFRWLNDLYIGGLYGFEKQMTLNFTTFVMISIKHIGGLLFIMYFSKKIDYLFAYFAVVALINFLINLIIFYRVFPKTRAVGFRLSLKKIKIIMPLAGSVSWSCFISFASMQTDKIVFSHILPLAQYGYFCMCTMIASAILDLCNPINHTVMPKMNYLLSSDKKPEMLDLYCYVTNINCFIVCFAAVFTVLFSKQILFIWFGSLVAADFGYKILIFYTMSSAFSLIATMPYYLQLSYGSLSGQNIYGTVFGVIRMSVIFFTAFYFGVYVTSQICLVLTIMFSIMLAWIVHRRFAASVFFRWFKNVTLIFLSGGMVLFIFDRISDVPIIVYNRFGGLLKISELGLSVLLLMLLAIFFQKKINLIR